MTTSFHVVKTHNEKQLGALREYVDKSELGAYIKKDLLTKYIKGKTNTKEGFYIGYREEYVGLLTQCYGTVALLLLLNGYDTQFSESEKEIIAQNVESILNYIDENGYDMDPFIEGKNTFEIFSKDKYRYTDSLSWVLSVIVQTRFAFSQGHLHISEELNFKLAEKARDILLFFIDTVVGGEQNPQGWGYVNGCKEPSVYFTYAVTESYNDFEDYILGNQDINTPEDSEFISMINRNLSVDNEIQTRLGKIKKQIGITMWNKYKDFLHTDFIGDNGAKITEDQIRNSTRTSSLFYTTYIVCTLIYCEADKFITEESEKDRILIETRQALQMVSSYYDVLKNDGLDNIVDKHIISFDQAHPDKKMFSRVFSGVSIYASTLTPVLIKANGLLTFYITQFPEREMSRYFDMALEKRINNGEQWLWEDSKYELATTERYIEAILDFYDYYEKFEKAYLKTKIEIAEEEQKIEARLSERLIPELKKQVEDELKKTHEQELQELQEKLVANYQIEEMINKKIITAIETQTLSVLKNALQNIISINQTGQSTQEETDLFAKMLMDVIKSYLFKYTYEANKINDELFTKEELVEKFSKDADEFLQDWFKFLVTFEGKHGLKFFFTNSEKEDYKLLRNTGK